MKTTTKTPRNSWPTNVSKCQRLLADELRELTERAEHLPFGLEYLDKLTGDPSPGRAGYKKQLLYLYWRLLEKEVGAENVTRYRITIRNHYLIFVEELKTVGRPTRVVEDVEALL